MKKRVLLVDDDEEIRIVYKRQIENGGYKVFTANGGDEALEKIKSQKPDLVILDIMMPEMDGWQVAKKIRKDLKSKVPILILSVLGFSEDKIRSEVEGANIHLVKPVSSYELISNIKYLLHEN